MKMDQIKSIEEKMEKNFRNFGGDGYNNFSYAHEYNYATGPQAGQDVSRLNPNSSIVTLVLTNSIDEAQTITILNPGSGSTPDSTSIPAGCSVTMKQGSYSGLLTRISQKPFLIQGLKIKAKSDSQFDNPIICGYNSNLGSAEYNTLTLDAYTSMYQNVSTRIDIPQFRYTVDIDSYVQVSVNGTDDGPAGGERLTLNFFLTAQLQPGRQFVGMNSYAVNQNSYISGLPETNTTIQLDAMPAPSVQTASRMMSK